MKKITPWELGGTLFVPATHQHLEPIMLGEKFPGVRSIVIDTEDGLAERALPEGLAKIARLFDVSVDNGPHVFIRPRNPDTLDRLLAFNGIETVAGFVLPKFGEANADAYLARLSGTSFLFMPSIEGRELFETDALQRLREKLLPLIGQIPIIRFGAEDMFRQLGLRRDCETSLYDMTAPSVVIGRLLGVFKPYGFDIAAPVYRCYKDREGFERDVRRDLCEGLVSKTVIHPDQARWLDEVYAVEPSEYDEARKLVDSDDAVFGQNGSMAETLTQSPWATRLLERARLYGLR